MGEMKNFRMESADPSELARGEYEKTVLGMLEKNTRSFENLEGAAALWISNLGQLEDRVPHNDVIEDNKTQSYHVLKNAWTAKLMELSELRDELESEKTELGNLAQDFAS